MGTGFGSDFLLNMSSRLTRSAPSLCRMEYFLEIGILRVLLIFFGQQQLRKPHDYGQQVVEVMGNPSGKSSDGLHLLGLEKLLLNGQLLRYISFDSYKIYNAS